MSDKIKLLPEIVANQIAAGEVVNSPSNVIKEMMENSLDAGARSIKVNFRDGGKELIQIVDDGSGMSPLDARMAFDRHATSKISSFDDIYSLHTFGFRGEALASIAAVAEIELRTRQADDEVGTQTVIRGGEFQSQTPIMCPAGSQFLVRNLFYNVPSRRKFIEGDNSRLSSQMKQEFTRVALCNPEVEFELLSNDSPLFRLPATNRAGRIVDLIGRHIKQNLLDVAVSTSVVSLSGFVGRPAAAKKRNSEQYLFVNGRYFQSPQLHKAVCRAYDKLIPEGSMPSYFLYLTVDPERVDVNVHPQKTTEVRRPRGHNTDRAGRRTRDARQDGRRTSYGLQRRRPRGDTGAAPRCRIPRTAGHDQQRIQPVPRGVYRLLGAHARRSVHRLRRAIRRLHAAYAPRAGTATCRKQAA